MEDAISGMNAVDSFMSQHKIVAKAVGLIAASFKFQVNASVNLMPSSSRCRNIGTSTSTASTVGLCLQTESVSM